MTHGHAMTSAHQSLSAEPRPMTDHSTRPAGQVPSGIKGVAGHRQTPSLSGRPTKTDCYACSLSPQPHGLAQPACHLHRNNRKARVERAFQLSSTGTPWLAPACAVVPAVSAGWRQGPGSGPPGCRQCVQYPRTGVRSLPSRPPSPARPVTTAGAWWMRGAWPANARHRYSPDA